MTAGSYDEIATRYEERKQSGPAAAWSEDLMHRWFEMLPRPARVLDLGCGHGFEVARMSDSGLGPVGLDLSLGMLKLAHRRVAGRLVQGEARRLPLGTATVHGVWSLHVLLHVPDLRGATLEIARVLRPGGLAALTIALGDGTTVEPVPYQPEVLREFTHRTRQAALEVVEAADLAVVDAGVDTDGRSTLWLLARRACSRGVRPRPGQGPRRPLTCGFVRCCVG